MKQKVGIVIKETTKNIELARFTMSVDSFDGSEILRKLFLKQREEDFLNFGQNVSYPDYSFGIRSFIKKGSVISTENLVDAESYHTNNDGLNSFMAGNSMAVNRELSKNKNNPVIVNGKEVYLSFIFYRTGYVIGTGQKCSSIFGLTSHDAYIRTFGSSNVHCSALDTCRTFESIKKVTDYLKKNEHNCKFLCRKYGWKFNVQPVSTAFSSDNMILSPKKAAKLEDEKYALEELLREINSERSDDSLCFRYPEVSEGIATVEEQKKEALLRLKVLGDTRIVYEALENNKIYTSRYGGILYELTEEQKKDVEELRSKGYYVYHVIETKGLMSDGSYLDFTDYLTVSNNKEEWEYERPDGKYNMIDSSCKTVATHGDFEYGSIYIEASMGGIKRLSDTEIMRKVG